MRMRFDALGQCMNPYRILYSANSKLFLLIRKVQEVMGFLIVTKEKREFSPPFEQTREVNGKTVHLKEEGRVSTRSSTMTMTSGEALTESNLKDSFKERALKFTQDALHFLCHEASARSVELIFAGLLPYTTNILGSLTLTPREVEPICPMLEMG